MHTVQIAFDQKLGNFIIGAFADVDFGSDDENSYTTAVKPLYRMTVNWLEVVQPSEKGSVLGEIRFKGRYILHVSYMGEP